MKIELNVFNIINSILSAIGLIGITAAITKAITLKNMNSNYNLLVEENAQSVAAGLLSASDI